MFTDYDYDRFDRGILENNTVLGLKLEKQICCDILSTIPHCRCPDDFDQEKIFFEMLIKEIMNILSTTFSGRNFNQNLDCNGTNEDLSLKSEIEMELQNNLVNSYKALYFDNEIMKMKTLGIVQTISGVKQNENIGSFDSTNGFSLRNDQKMPTIRRFLRIGTTHVNEIYFRHNDFL